MSGPSRARVADGQAAWDLTQEVDYGGQSVEEGRPGREPSVSLRSACCPAEERFWAPQLRSVFFFLGLAVDWLIRSLYMGRR